MTSAIVPLRDDHVDARPDDLFGVLDLADHRHDLGAIGMEPIHPGFRIAKAGSINRHLFLDHHFHLRLKEFLREQLRAALAHFRRARRPHGGGSIDLRKLFTIHEVARELLIFTHQIHGILGCSTALRGRAAPDRRGEQRIDTERFVGQFPGLANPVTQLIGRTRRGTQDPEPAGIRNRSRQRRNARSAHPGKQDRVPDPQHFAYSALQRHSSSPATCLNAHSNY